MRTACRRFDLYRIGMEDVERCGAWTGGARVSFTYADSLGFQRVRKRNTSFFDALTDACGLSYRVSEGVLTELMYEAAVVVLSQPKDGSFVRCRQGEAGALHLRSADELHRAIFRQGFQITGVPGCREPVIFVPFVASASMSREAEYLFVNRDRLDAVLRKTSLDMVCGSGEYVPVISGRPLPKMKGAAQVGLRKNERHISPPKLAAYLGLSLSDGASVRELLTAQAYRREMAKLTELPEVDALLEGSAELPRVEAVDKSAWLLGLNEHNTICVNDCTSFDLGLSALNACWVNSEIPMEARLLPLPERYRRKEALPEPGALAEVFGTLAALAGSDETEKEQACQRFELLLSAPESPVWAQWRSAAEAFFTAPGMLELPRGPIPLPGGAAEAQANLNTLAFLYAATPSMTNGRREFRPKAEPGQRGVIGLAQLRQTIESYRRSPKARRQLWKTLAQRHASRCRMIRAETVSGGVMIESGTPEKTTYRAELRHIGEGSQLNRGRLSDGCGFMEPSLFDRLERLLRGRERREDEEPINAVQVRLPWCKGLLVRFSFSDYLLQWATAQGADPAALVMRDVYGCERPLFDEYGHTKLQVIFTDSMFKGANWFRQLEGERDRWALYWERLRVHGASILVAGKSTPPGMESRLNYQFLSTLGMKPEEVWALADKRMKLLAKARTDDAVLARLVCGAAKDEEDGTDAYADGVVELLEDLDLDGLEDDGEELLEEDGYAALLRQMLKKHPALMRRTVWVSGRYNSLVQSEMMQLLRGRLPVEGDVRYVLPDLLAMIRCMARELVRSRDGRALQAEDCVSAINRFDASAPQGRYFAPGGQVPWTWRREDRRGEAMEVAILRNPHYASGEEPVLQPLPSEELAVYKRWFGRLTGCVMVPCAAMMTLNGADSDGDRVNVCAQQSVIRAIRRRAAQTNELLAQAVARREEMIGWLAEEAERTPRRETAAYLTLLAGELGHILPGRLRAQKQGWKYSPPLLFAGSDAKGTRYSPEELQGVHLRDCLWDSFCLSRGQEIGRLSLDMLDRAANAYAETDERFTKATPVERLLSAFMARYLAVADALDTALEIDMAKTGLSCERTELKKPDSEVKQLLGLTEGCRFRAWRRMYMKNKHRLGSDFTRVLEAMTAEFTGRPPRRLLTGWRRAGQAERYAGRDAQGHSLRLRGYRRLPVLPVPPETGLTLDGLPEVVSRMWRSRRRTLRMNGHARLHALMRKPDCTPTEAQLARAKEQAAAYEMNRRRLRWAAWGERTADSAGRELLRWLLANGFSLDEAVKAVQTLEQLFVRWEASVPEELPAMLRHLEQAAAETENAAAWGWANRGRRETLLTKLLVLAAAQAGAKFVPVLTAEERSLLTCSSRSIQLLRLAAAYGRRRVSIGQRSAVVGSTTPDQLAALLWETAGDDKEMYYALCWELSGNTWQCGKRSLYYLGDFLTAYLLRDVLGGCIAVKEQGEESNDCVQRAAGGG